MAIIKNGLTADEILTELFGSVEDGMKAVFRENGTVNTEVIKETLEKKVIADAAIERETSQAVSESGMAITAAVDTDGCFANEDDEAVTVLDAANDYRAVDAPDNIGAEARRIAEVIKAEKTIHCFEGEYAFLNNFFEPANGIRFVGEKFRCSEAVYQSQKTHDINIRRAMINMNGSEAKRFGRHSIVLRPDWKERDVRLFAMKRALTIKFRDAELAQKLIATGDKILVDENRWSDRFWGIKNGKGENMLGRLLMEVRELKSRVE